MRPLFSWIWFLTLTSLLRLTACKPVVPFKITPRALPRSSWKRYLVPKKTVSLPYAPAGAQRPTTSLTFEAYENVPIMLLEDIEFLVETVVCYVVPGADDSVVEVVFNSQDACAATSTAWSSLSQFIVVTLHAGCNPSEQRGAWMVSSVSKESEYVLSLQVRSIALRAIGSTFRISHVSDSVVTGYLSQQALQRRDIDDIFPVKDAINFAPRQQLLPVNDTLIDDLGSALLPDPLGLQVFCVDCISTMDFSVGLEFQISDTLDITEAWVNVTVNSFQHDINLEISMDAAHTWTDVFDVLLVAVPDLGVSFTDVATIGFFWGAAVRTNVTVEGALNFTVGASANIPTGATATFVATDTDQSSASGWDGASFDVHPFRLNSGSFSLTAGVSLSPFLDATVAFGTGSGSSARLYVNTPYVSGTATIALDVNRECQPLGPDDFESFATALTFGAGLDISLEGNASGTHLPDLDQIFLSKGFPLGDLPTLDDPKCMVFASDDTAGANAGLAGLLPAVTGTLVDASVAVPTFNIPGIEAYYSAHGALPTNVNYTQMLLATSVPADIQSAVQHAATESPLSPKHHSSKTGAIVGGVIGGVAAVVFVAIAVWYLLFRRPKPEDSRTWYPDPHMIGPDATPGTEKKLSPWPNEPIPRQLEPVDSMPELGRNHPTHTHTEEYQPWAEEHRQTADGANIVSQATITSAEVQVAPRPEEQSHPQRTAPPGALLPETIL